jgi:hypothetical protein
MKLIVLLAISSAGVAIAEPAQAINFTIDPSIATASTIAPGAIIDSDLKARTWSLHPTLGYFTGSNTVDGSGATASSSGLGGTGQAQYSFNDHIGINFSGLDYSGSGNFTPGTSPLGGSSGQVSISGWLMGATLVLDPFSGSGFRMPFFFGLNYEHVSSSTPSSGIIIAETLSSPGYTLGFSPRFNIGFLRLAPFLVTTTTTSKGTVTCSASIVAGACGAQDIEILPVFGVNITFRPWNLSFFFNLSSFLMGTGFSFYSLGPQLTF